MCDTVCNVDEVIQLPQLRGAGRTNEHANIMLLFCVAFLRNTIKHAFITHTHTFIYNCAICNCLPQSIEINNYFFNAACIFIISATSKVIDKTETTHHPKFDYINSDMFFI